MSSRAEMDPLLKPLLRSLKPMVIHRVGSTWRWADAPVEPESRASGEIAADPNLLGHQISLRKAMRSVLNYEQQRLCELKMDGRPRLVRGVAGSGKTLVLAHWFSKTLDSLNSDADWKIWVVFANNALSHLLVDTIKNVWTEQNDTRLLPWHRVEVLHIRKLLKDLLCEVGKRMGFSDYEFDLASESYLTAMAGKTIKTRCKALFVDEGQDLGPNTLKLLTRSSSTETNSIRKADPSISFTTTHKTFGAVRFQME